MYKHGQIYIIATLSAILVKNCTTVAIRLLDQLISNGGNQCVSPIVCQYCNIAILNFQAFLVTLVRSFDYQTSKKSNNRTYWVSSNRVITVLLPIAQMLIPLKQCYQVPIKNVFQKSWRDMFTHSNKANLLKHKSNKFTIQLNYLLGSVFNDEK